MAEIITERRFSAAMSQFKLGVGLLMHTHWAMRGVALGFAIKGNGQWFILSLRTKWLKLIKINQHRNMHYYE